ncbi:hypothetical protein [Pseudomonas sp. NPDC007930]|uniref:hypothetical protein n=1 Tax=Pseudomonas sp. NPDC007930 TaxID=3364417 RepID=UPI0036DFB9D1
MKARNLLWGAWLAAGPVLAGGYTHADICKAVVALEVGHEISRMRITHSGNTPEIVYIHKGSPQRSQYRCQFSGEEKVSWASYQDDKKSPGRWHEEGALSYVQKGTHLIVKSAKGREREFATRDFRQ